MFSVVRTGGVVAGLCTLAVGVGTAVAGEVTPMNGTAASGLSLATTQPGPEISGSIDISRHNSTITVQVARILTDGNPGILKTLQTRQRKAGSYSFTVHPGSYTTTVTFEVVVSVRSLHRTAFVGVENVTLSD